MTEYTLLMADRHDGHNKVEFGTEKPDEWTIKEEIEDWVTNGEWGNDGAEISVHWTLEDEDENEVDSGWHTVLVEPDHHALIAQATRYCRNSCGNDPDNHDWTSQGAWSAGGTAMTFKDRCRKCGLVRREYHTGPQKNPDEHDTVAYEMPDED